MLNALNRIFHSGSSGSEPSPVEKTNKPQRSLPPLPPILPSDGTMSRKPSSLLTDSRIRRDHPSQVAWISPSSQTGSGSFTNRSFGKPGGSSSPLPSPLLEASGTRSKLVGTRKASSRRLSSGSMNLHSLYLSDQSETSSIAAEAHNKPLSPIHEQQQATPSSLRPLLDSFPRTPDSTGTGFCTFILRWSVDRNLIDR